MFAIYYEFKKDDGSIYQALFIPAAPLGIHAIQPTYAFKELTPARARRAWSVYQNPVYELSGEPTRDMDDLLARELKQLIGIHVYMTSPVQDPDWQAVGVFPVQVTDSDLYDLKENGRRMPTALNERIKRLRQAEGFPEFPVAS